MSRDAFFDCAAMRGRRAAPSLSPLSDDARNRQVARRAPEPKLPYVAIESQPQRDRARPSVADLGTRSDDVMGFQYSKDSSARRATEPETDHGYAPEPPRRLSPDAATHADDAAPSLSVLGKTLVFTGDLTANEDLLIQGRFEGSITHTGNHLAIGAHGDVKANITGRRVIIQGKVVGDVRAVESIVVEVSANVRGNLYAPRISVKDGAKFRGTVDMENVNDGSGDTQRLPISAAGRSTSNDDPSADADEILS
jgi:cytoskeletal protein CcmA (bactofilin family)